MILKGITGCAEPGDMIAIMGTSGAGKTSLLNVLSGRHVMGDILGTILLNGEKRDRLFKRKSAFVEQDDMLFSNLTVRETFEYQALLRLPHEMPREAKIKR